MKEKNRCCAFKLCNTPLKGRFKCKLISSELKLKNYSNLRKYHSDIKDYVLPKNNICGAEETAQG